MTSSGVTTNALADQAATPKCEQVLSACDQALRAKQRELDLADLGIKLRDENRTELQKENARLREESSAWYKSPAIWAAIGVIAGTYIGARATR